MVRIILSICICFSFIFAQQSFLFNKEVQFQSYGSSGSGATITLLLSTSESYSAMGTDEGFVIKNENKQIIIREKIAVIMPAIRVGDMYTSDIDITEKDEKVSSFKKSGKTKKIAGILCNEYILNTQKGDRGRMWIGNPKFKMHGDIGNVIQKISSAIPGYSERLGVVMEMQGSDGAGFKILSIKDIKKVVSLSDYQVQDLSKMGNMKHLMNSLKTK